MGTVQAGAREAAQLCAGDGDVQAPDDRHGARLGAAAAEALLGERGL